MLSCNGKHYKQLHSTAMGSLISVFVSEIDIMQNIKEQALATYTIRELFLFGYATVC